MPQPRHVLNLESRPSPDSMQSEWGSSCFIGSEDYMSLNIMWTTNKAAFFVRSNQLGSWMVMVMMSSMNPSIEASFALMSTSSWSDCTNGYEGGRLASLGSNCLWGDCRYVMSHEVSVSRSFQSYITVALVVVYSSGAGVVPKGKHMNRKANLPTIAMHVDDICVFAWMCRYAASRSIFPIRMSF